MALQNLDIIGTLCLEIDPIDYIYAYIYIYLNSSILRIQHFKVLTILAYSIPILYQIHHIFNVIIAHIYVISVK